MANDLNLKELEALYEHKQNELFPDLAGAEREQVLAEFRELRSQIRAAEQDLYFVLEIPEDLELEALSESELRDLGELTGKQILAAFRAEGLAGEDELIRKDRLAALRLRSQAIQLQIDSYRRDSYDPGPEGPPVFEPSGYSARPGFVKSEPGNNEYYVEQFRDDPWYPIIRSTHDALERLIPGYNISQIKEKFGGLRYYYSFPETIPVRAEWPAYSTEDKIRAMADSVITRAEGWVEGYEHARRNFEEQNNREKE